MNHKYLSISSSSSVGKIKLRERVSWKKCGPAGTAPMPMSSTLEFELLLYLKTQFLSSQHY